MKYTILCSCLCDDGYVWYAIHTLDSDIWRWIRNQSTEKWVDTAGISSFDIREDLFTIFAIRWSA
jgi:hypothetical protein